MCSILIRNSGAHASLSRLRIGYCSNSNMEMEYGNYTDRYRYQ